MGGGQVDGGETAPAVSTFDDGIAIVVAVMLAIPLAATYVVEHPFVVATAIAAVASFGFLLWRARRRKPEPDPGQHRHYPGIQVLKTLALANNRIDQSDRDIVGAYMRTVPDNLLSAQVAETMVSADLPSPMDLDRHIDGARRSLDGNELRTLIDHVRLMRRVERRLTPVTREWFDRAERGLSRPVTALDPSRAALGLEHDFTPPFDPGQPLASHLERFDAIVHALRDPDIDVEVRRALSRMREPIETLDSIQTDDEAEAAIDDILDRQLAGVVSSYASVLALRETRADEDARPIVIRSLERLTEAADAIVSRLSADALSRLDTVGRYVEAKNPVGIDAR